MGVLCQKDIILCRRLPLIRGFIIDFQHFLDGLFILRFEMVSYHFNRLLSMKQYCGVKKIVFVNFYNLEQISI
jgi:hypothetical protein